MSLENFRGSGPEGRWGWVKDKRLCTEVKRILENAQRVYQTASSPLLPPSALAFWALRNLSGNTTSLEHRTERFQLVQG